MSKPFGAPLFKKNTWQSLEIVEIYVWRADKIGKWSMRYVAKISQMTHPQT